MRFAITALASLVLAACGGDGAGTSPTQLPSPPTATTPPPVATPVVDVGTPRIDPPPAQAPTPTPTPATSARKAHYGHYFAANHADTPDQVAMLCGQPGVSGVLYRRAWKEVEPAPGTYDFSAFDAVLSAIADSQNPQCQLWLFIEFKGFVNSANPNPCPVYLQSSHSAPNSSGGQGTTCFMWEPLVRDAYASMMRAAGSRYDGNPRVEGLVLQESALGLNGAYSQDVADGGTYTAIAWRDALIALIQSCSQSFPTSRCMAFANFLRNGQQYLYDISAAIAAIPDNRGCLSGPDLLPDETPLYQSDASVYEVLTRHAGCRANSVQHDSYAVAGCGLDCIFQFGVRGTYGDFAQTAPRESGVCVNSYIFWTHRLGRSATGLSWLDALPVIAAYPYGPGWLERCAGGGAAP